MYQQSSKLSINLLGSFFLSVSLLVSPVMSYAHGDEHHESAAQTEKVKTPEKAADIWKAIDSELMELKGTIHKNQLANVHHHAFAIRDLVKTLPEHSPMLSQAQLRQVTLNVKFVETLAQRLDDSGDKNDKVVTEANLEKLNKILTSMRKYYAANTLEKQ